MSQARSVGRLGFAIALIACIGTAHAQTVAGAVSGLILDPSGAPVPGATVTLTRQETGAQKSATSDARGEFTITAVAPGEYRLEAEHQGFLHYVRTLVMEVDQQQDLRVDLALDAAGKVTVEVPGIAPLVRTESANRTLRSPAITIRPLSKARSWSAFRQSPLHGFMRCAGSSAQGTI